LYNYNGKQYAFGSVLCYASIAEFENSKLVRAGYCKERFKAHTDEEKISQIISFCNLESISTSPYCNVDTNKWKLWDIDVNVFALEFKNLAPI